MYKRIIDGLEANDKEIKKAIDGYDRSIVDFEHTWKRYVQELRKLSTKKECES